MNSFFQVGSGSVGTKRTGPPPGLKARGGTGLEEGLVMVVGGVAGSLRHSVPTTLIIHLTSSLHHKRSLLIRCLFSRVAGGSGSGRIQTFLVGSGKFSPDPNPIGTLAM